MDEIRLSTDSEIERQLLEQWCNRNSVRFVVVGSGTPLWTVKLLRLAKTDQRYTDLTHWLAAVPSAWKLDSEPPQSPRCQ